MPDRIPKWWKPLGSGGWFIRAELEALGARFDPQARMWFAPPERAAEAEALMRAQREGKRDG